MQYATMPLVIAKPLPSKSSGATSTLPTLYRLQRPAQLSTGTSHTSIKSGRSVDSSIALSSGCGTPAAASDFARHIASTTSRPPAGHSCQYWPMWRSALTPDTQWRVLALPCVQHGGHPLRARKARQVAQRLGHRVCRQAARISKRFRAGEDVRCEARRPLPALRATLRQCAPVGSAGLDEVVVETRKRLKIGRRHCVGALRGT